MMIHIITSNEGKFREMRKMIETVGHQAIREELHYPEVQVDSLKEVVKFGVNWIDENIRTQWLNDEDHGFLIDDSGIFIKSLKNFPGVYSKFVFFTIGISGILRLMKGIENREAEFKTSLMFRHNSKNHYFEGICPGEITEIEKGKHGFGYDPIFVPKGSKRTFSEMGTMEKNNNSHRGKAVTKFLSHLENRR